jgi:hypothetical protein
LAVIEGLTELAGAKVAKVAGLVNLEGAFTKGAVDVVRKAWQKGGQHILTKGVLGSVAEGGEEVAADLLNYVVDTFRGKEANIEDLPMTFAVGVLAGAAGHAPPVAAYLLSPNKKTAEAAGIPPELSRTQRKRVELAEAVKAQLSNLNSSQSQTGQDGQEVSTILDTDPEAQAPTSPVDTSVAETTTEPDQALPTQPEPSGEAVGGEQAFTEPETPAEFVTEFIRRGNNPFDVLSMSKEEFEAAVGAQPQQPAVLGRKKATAEFTIKPGLFQQIKDFVKGDSTPPVNVTTDETGATTIDAPFTVTSEEAVPPPKKRLGRKVQPPVAPENVKQVLQNAPESKMDRLKREKREQENARNIRTGNGESPSQAKGWLRDAISRRPQGIDTPANIADWMERGFSNSHYWKLLKKDGVTLEEAVAREMQPDIQNPVSEPAPNVPKAGQPQEDISSPSVAPPDAPSAVPPPSPQRDSGVATAPTATARVSLDAIPTDIEVDVQAIKSKSGERVSVNLHSRKACWTSFRDSKPLENNWQR